MLCGLDMPVFLGAWSRLFILGEPVVAVSGRRAEAGLPPPGPGACFPRQLPLRFLHHRPLPSLPFSPGGASDGDSYPPFSCWFHLPPLRSLTKQPLEVTLRAAYVCPALALCCAMQGAPQDPLPYLDVETEVPRGPVTCLWSRGSGTFSELPMSETWVLSEVHSFEVSFCRQSFSR